MSPSEKVRALLDERGIEHVDADDGHTQHTWWSDGDHEIGACDSGERLAVYNLTPEQAVAATVGTKPDEATMLKLHDRMNAALLDYESAMGIEGGNGANTVPLVIEMHQIIEDAAVAGVGTCTIVKTWTDSDYADHWRYSCSECGYRIEVGERDVATGKPTSHANFCWNCGRKVIGIRED